MKNQSFLPSLQVFRGIAALMVVFHHLWNQISFFFAIHNVALDQLAADGQYGVDFFFVLSGFIICYSNYNKAQVRSASGEYLRNRILRIYLPYLPLSFLMLLSYRIFPSLSQGDRDISVVKSIFLLPVPGFTALAVARTLVYEIFFYTVFITFFFSTRLFYGLLLLWALMIGVAGRSMPAILASLHSGHSTHRASRR